METLRKIKKREECATWIFFKIVWGAAALLWLAAGALAVEDRWRQQRLTKKSEEALDKLLEEVFGDED